MIILFSMVLSALLVLIGNIYWVLLCKVGELNDI